MKYTIILLVITILFSLYLVFGHNGLLKYREMVSIRAGYEEKLEEMDERLVELRNELEAAKNDKAYLESVIRRELGMQKSDEDVYILKDNGKK